MILKEVEFEDMASTSESEEVESQSFRHDTMLVSLPRSRCLRTSNRMAEEACFFLAVVQIVSENHSKSDFTS